MKSKLNTILLFLTSSKIGWKNAQGIYLIFEQYWHIIRTMLKVSFHGLASSKLKERMLKVTPIDECFSNMMSSGWYLPPV